MLIKIISGTYGYNTGFAIVPKTSDDEPFALEDAKAERLISLGVAVKVESEEKISDDTEGILENLEYNELKKKAKEYGIKAAGKKEELIKAILQAKESEVAPVQHEEDDEPMLAVELPQ